MTVAPPDLPSGPVTFLFTDVEGSTRILEALGFEATVVFDAHDRILRRVFAAHGGIEMRTQGDSFFVVFERARAAVAAAIAAQGALEGYPWPDEGVVRVRIGMHTGEAPVGESGYVGLAVHTAARITAAARGGQVLLSDTTRAAMGGDPPPFVTLDDLGLVELKDIAEPQRLFEVRHPVLEPAEREQTGAMAG
jgi:class 3 adenylate cyclase